MRRGVLIGQAAMALATEIESMGPMSQADRAGGGRSARRRVAAGRPERTWRAARRGR